MSDYTKIDLLQPPEIGTALITNERMRQIRQEGYTPEHDAKHHDTHDDLLHAAMCYVNEAIARQGNWANYPHHEPGSPPAEWPWYSGDWKPSDDPVEMLAKAGALVAAEIDRLVAERRQGG